MPGKARWGSVAQSCIQQRPDCRDSSLGVPCVTRSEFDLDQLPEPSAPQFPYLQNEELGLDDFSRVFRL